jgi:hypothetical protein
MQELLNSDVCFCIVKECTNHFTMISLLSVTTKFHAKKKLFCYDLAPVYYHPIMESLSYTHCIKNIFFNTHDTKTEDYCTFIPPCVNTLVTNRAYFRYGSLCSPNVDCIIINRLDKIGRIPPVRKLIFLLKEHDLKPGMIPYGVIHLKIQGAISLRSEIIPNSVEILDLGEFDFKAFNVYKAQHLCCFPCPVFQKRTIPSSVKTLILPKHYPLPIPKEYYPENLEELTVGTDFKDLNLDGTFIYNPNVKVNFI